MVAEDDSIVCVPAKLAAEVLDWAEEHEAVEEIIREMILKDRVPPGKYYNPENFDRLKEQRREA